MSRPGEPAGGGVAPASRWHRVRRGILRFARWLTVGEVFASGAVVVAMLVLVVAQVLSRYIVAVQIYWFEEIARLMLVWATFLSAAVVTGLSVHLCVTFLTDRFGPRVAGVFERIGEAAILVCSVVLLPAALAFVESTWQVTSTASGLPRTVFFLAPLIGFALMAFHSLVNLVLKRAADLDHPLESSAVL